MMLRGSCVGATILPRFYIKSLVGRGEDFRFLPTSGLHTRLANPSCNMASDSQVHESTHIISTMRFDSRLLMSTSNQEMSISGDPTSFYMFLYHRDRMLQAARDFQWTEAVDAISGNQGAYYLHDALMLHLNEKARNLTSLPQPARVRLPTSFAG